MGGGGGETSQEGSVMVVTIMTVAPASAMWSCASFSFSFFPAFVSIGEHRSRHRSMNSVKHCSRATWSTMQGCGGLGVLPEGRTKIREKWGGGMGRNAHFSQRHFLIFLEVEDLPYTRAFLIQLKKCGVSGGQQNLHRLNRRRLECNRRRLEGKRRQSEGNRRRLEARCYQAKTRFFNQKKNTYPPKPPLSPQFPL